MHHTLVVRPSCDDANPAPTPQALEAAHGVADETALHHRVDVAHVVPVEALELADDHVRFGGGAFRRSVFEGALDDDARLHV